MKTILLGLTLAVTTLTSAAASVECRQFKLINSEIQLIAREDFSLRFEGEQAIFKRFVRAVYPRYIGNVTYPEIGVVTAFKGKGGRRATPESGTVTVRIDSSEIYFIPALNLNVVKGSLRLGGRDMQNRVVGEKDLNVACDPGILDIIRN